MIHCFRSKNFCLTVPKNFVGEPFCAVFQKISGIEEFMEERGGSQGFLPESFCLTETKTFTGAPISVSLFLGIEKL